MTLRHPTGRRRPCPVWIMPVMSPRLPTAAGSGCKSATIRITRMGTKKNYTVRVQAKNASGESAKVYPLTAPRHSPEGR